MAFTKDSNTSRNTPSYENSMIRPPCSNSSTTVALSRPSPKETTLPAHTFRRFHKCFPLVAPYWCNETSIWAPVSSFLFRKDVLAIHVLFTTSVSPSSIHLVNQKNIYLQCYVLFVSTTNKREEHCGSFSMAFERLILLVNRESKSFVVIVHFYFPSLLTTWDISA